MIIQRWVVAILGGAALLGAIPVMAQDDEIVVKTYYPSPRGVYDQLRTHGDVSIGRLAPPAARLHVIQEDAADAFRVDDETDDPTPFVIDRDGNVGIGVEAPGAKLDIDGGLTFNGRLEESGTTIYDPGQGEIPESAIFK